MIFICLFFATNARIIWGFICLEFYSLFVQAPKGLDRGACGGPVLPFRGVRGASAVARSSPLGESEGRARELSGKEIIILLCVEKIFAMEVSVVEKYLCLHTGLLYYSESLYYCTLNKGYVPARVFLAAARLPVVNSIYHTMKLLFLFGFFLLLARPGFSQITITTGDMPNAGDSVVVSSGIVSTPGHSFPTGEDYTWDYTWLTGQEQEVLHFLDVGNLNMIYQAAFNNPLAPAHRANYATEGGFMDIPGMPVSDPLTFFRNTPSGFGIIGYAGEYMGFPVPGRNDTLDVFYRFPLEYGDTSFSHTTVNQDIPSLGHVERQVIRHTQADGWGTLITPYGTFNVLRVRSQATYRDSVKIDTLPAFPPLVTQRVEYFFLSKDHGHPLLTIEVVGPQIARVEYIDSLRVTRRGPDHTHDQSLSIYPNPFQSSATLTWGDYPYHSLEVYTLYGQLVFRRDIFGLGDFHLDGGLFPSSGVYIVKLRGGSGVVSRIRGIKVK